MKKYVAFLDILGFKDTLRKMNQEAAKQFISNFSTTAFYVWEEKQYSFIEGYIVSDSFILYSQDVSERSLSQMIDLIEGICQRELINNKVLIRGAVAKGEFDRLEAKDLPSLKKGLIVGQAYVDAYLMEETIKTAGIILADEVYQDIEEISCSVDCFQESINGQKISVMRYLNYDFFGKVENLTKFIELAIDANWIPHYYNTLYWALKDEKPQKADFLFTSIINSICNGNLNENWRDLDIFIKRMFDKNVYDALQTRFLRYIRGYLLQGKTESKAFRTQQSSDEKILNYLSARQNVTLSQIVSALGLTRASASRIVKRLVSEGKVVGSNSKNSRVYSLARSTNTISMPNALI